MWGQAIWGSSLWGQALERLAAVPVWSRETLALTVLGVATSVALQRRGKKTPSANGRNS